MVEKLSLLNAHKISSSQQPSTFSQMLLKVHARTSVLCYIYFYLLYLFSPFFYISIALIEQYSFIRIVQCANLLIAILSLTNSYLSVRLVALFQQNNNKKINLRASSYSLSKFQSNFPTWPILKGNTTFGLRKISYLNCHPGKCIH